MVRNTWEPSLHSAIHHVTALPGIAAVTVTSDRSFPRHSHDEFGVGYIVHGGQTSWSGRGMVDAQAGNIITVNPSEIHDGIGKRGQPRMWQMLYFDPERLDSYVDLDPARLAFENPVLMAGHMRQVLRSAFADVTTGATYQDSAEENVLVALRGLLNAPATRIRTVHSRAVARMIERIHAEWSEPLSLADLAATAGLSRYQALRHFEKQVGATPHAYLTQHRVKRARRAILNGTPLSQAAVASGFADQSHMNRAFGRQFGISPGRIRSGSTADCNIVQ